MKQKIAFLGPNGTFTEAAVRGLLETIVKQDRRAEFELTPMKTIPDCLTACWKDQVEFAMVPVENTIEGSVSMTLDWLIHQVDIPIQAEVVIPIEQYAILHPQNKDLALEQITRIYSHSHAIAQCHHFIREHCPKSEIEYTKSTAEAVEWVAKHPEEKYLAIGPKLAAGIHDLVIKASEIQDYTNNFTRFVLVGKKPITEWFDQNKLEELGKTSELGKTIEPGKTSILVTLPEDFPGALHQVLSAFAWRRLNLSRIESRPTKKGLGSYFFFIDIEQKMDDVLLPGAISEIEALGCQVRFLGSYPCFFPKEMSKMPT